MSDEKILEEITVVKGAIVLSPKGPADRKPDAKILNKVLQMNGETVTRELPAEHQIITGEWGREFYTLPYLVYLPEKDRLLLLYNSFDPQNSLNFYLILISSNDHGQTWSNPTKHVKDARGISHRLTGGLGLAYFGNGQLTMDVSDENFGQFSLFSRDYGEKWVFTPLSKDSGGFPWNRWDPCLADVDPITGELKRLIDTGYSFCMERAFADAKKIFVFPDEWYWRHDSQNRGLVEEWYKEGSFDEWPRLMRIDKHWTLQGEPDGVGWYAKSFEMSETGGAPLVILFGAIDGYCDVFLDGKKIGEQKVSPEIMWNTPFHIPLDGGLSVGIHRMVIRVEKKCTVDSNAGIYLPVWIVEKPVPDNTKNKTLPVYYYNSLARIRFSYDGGLSWPEEIEPPSWNGASGVGVSEVAVCRAGNNDIIAACRITDPKYYNDESNIKIDHYCGLGVSISRDDGYTWTKIKVLYEYGRHHPSMVLMPNGDIVMTYVVRLGFLEKEHCVLDDDGYPQWSIEAVVSRDNGKNWDLAHKYILAKWSGMSQAQSTTTVLLPDGSLLTAFGSGYLSQPVKEEKRQVKSTGFVAPPNLLFPHEVCLVRWRPVLND